MKNPRFTACLCILAFGFHGAMAEPYRPKGDAEILERAATPGPAGRELRRLRAEVARQPDQSRIAFELTQRYIRQGRSDADPRYYGYAEAVLQPWLRAATPPADALLLHATVLQNRHAFPAALAELDRALRSDPRLGSAWLTRAAILEVQGDYPAALQSCLAVAKYASPLSSAVCFQSALSLSGQAAASYAQLVQAVESTAASPSERQWAQTTLAELAERLDRPADAESWYRQALAADKPTTYVLATYADFLLQQNRPAEARELLRDETRADPLLLRLTLAEQRLGAAEFTAHADSLNARFAAANARGDATHQGDESRYALHIRRDVQAALQLALANWAVQKEPRDARLVLEAAGAANDPDAAKPVLDFLARTRLEDARLAAWAQQLRRKGA